ncbi:MAG: PQQ-dependent dehydrogenase, methanol/ethanol family [Pseudomonadales bacterium]|jgi:PQQ-dependent dehydrogenase (methanol/ethanol family)|nr:PQQ-dependent dehydrogenase, methanol/ethanol family [Pseudomonadales bacterium]
MRHFHHSVLFSTTLAACALLVSGCSGNGESTAQGAAAAAAFAQVTQERLNNAASEPQQWLMVGGTYDERHYSPLDEISRNNLGQLGLGWFADYDINLSQQGTPLYVDGVLYVSTAWSTVYAFDARSGAQLWHFDPKTPKEIAVKVCCGIVNRGIAAFEGKIYVGTLDGYLIAIDAKTGKEAWRKLTVNPDEQYTVTSAPRVVKGQVLIGNSGSEFGVRGYLGAYDARTGADRWRVYTVPGNPELGFENSQMAEAAKTWSGEWWKLGGGGTVWDAIVYDAKDNLVIFGTGNGTPWDQRTRDPAGGDNLFVASILAVDADTGAYAWHYQTTPGDTWDYDAMSPMMLLDLDFNGEARHVVAQANKNGMFYVLDAANGELLKADAFTEVNWNTGVDMNTGRPIEVPAARYDRDNIFNLAPGVQGGHGWHANAWNPDTNLVYIATQRAYFVMRSSETFTPSPKGTNMAIDMGASLLYYRDHPDAERGFVGYVSAWDPVTGKEVWRGEEHDGPTGGLLSTAGGLVFSGGGNNNNEFRAYDIKSGDKLWSFDTQTGMVAAPITYELDGKQYVAASVGINQAGNYYAPNHSRLLVFTLGGDAVLPEPVSFAPPQLNPPPATAAPEQVAAGQELYNNTCAICHGNGGAARGANFPNLMVSPMLHSQEGFDSIVLGGARQERGMVSFASRISASDTAAIRAYLISRANELLAQQRAAPPIETAPAPEPLHEETQTTQN